MAHISTERIAALRQWMKENRFKAFVVPTADPHGSEYIAAHWKCREWLTGFDGSAGTAVVTEDEALLWTDSRYWLQAKEQLDGSEIRLMRDGDEGVPSVEHWLREHFSGNSYFFVGKDEGLVPKEANEGIPHFDYIDHLPPSCDKDPFETIWHDRPALPDAPVRLQPLEYAGCSIAEKMKMTEEWLGQYAGSCSLIVSDLAEIAWMLNLRGSDIDFNPVFYAYLLISFPEKTATLCIDEKKVPAEVREYLSANGISVAPYDSLPEASYKVAKKYVFVCKGLTKNLYSKVYSDIRKTYIIDSPLQHFKALKNPTEQQGFRRAMERDGVAMVRMLRWLEENPRQTELSVAQKLESLRAEGENYCGASFETISAYGAHAAIVHYEPTAESNIPLQQNGLLLLDSGGQYLDGTTDITRTIALGPLCDEEKLIYTLVLKGHIALSLAHFPKGTPGIALDALARKDVWSEGYDYGHGTGHGVGSNLCVHEGPQQIRKNLNAPSQYAFEPGMTITDEPGIYVEEKYGVRIENMLLCHADEETPFGNFCSFEVLTLCPIDTRPIVLSMLTAEERDWLNTYHSHVRSRLLPLLSDAADKEWLENATKPI